MKKVLIVEDVDLMREVLELVVSRCPGFAVSGKAKNGFEARLEISRRRPDVVLLDEILPGESSVDFLNELSGQGIPVLLVTGMSEATHPVPPLALGRLLKPAWDTLDRDEARFGKALRKALEAVPEGSGPSKS